MHTITIELEIKLNYLDTKTLKIVYEYVHVHLDINPKIVQWLEHWWLVYTAVSISFLSPLEKPHTCRFRIIEGYFLGGFILKTV